MRTVMHIAAAAGSLLSAAWAYAGRQVSPPIVYHAVTVGAPQLPAPPPPPYQPPRGSAPKRSGPSAVFRVR
jgi:hypothetical protein